MEIIYVHIIEWYEYRNLYVTFMQVSSFSFLGEITFVIAVASHDIGPVVTVPSWLAGIVVRNNLSERGFLEIR